LSRVWTVSAKFVYILLSSLVIFESGFLFCLRCN
jgi:hypothetical protein